MSYINFKNTIQKYIVKLLFLHFFVIVGLAGYYQVQIQEQKQVRTTFIELFSEHPKSKGIAVSDRTNCILNGAYDGVKTGSKNTVFLEGATKIQAHTKQIIASIDKSIVNKNGFGKKLNINDVVNDYYEHVLHLSEKSGLDSIELRRFNESYLSYSTPSDNMILQQQYHDLNDKETYIACLGKIKNDIKAIENDVISRLTAEIFTSLYGFTGFHPYVSAQSQLWQGDTLSAKIFIAEGTHIRTKVVIEKDTLDFNDYHPKNYQIKTNELGTHQLTGEILKTDAWGNTTHYPFTHEYTVIPKCKKK